ncbi:MAG: hypothetical protein KDD50_01820 [Bdellovibrionales bacterium]|nr:hypothetical protein [Bdellovibrionales bacterium]
MYNRAEIVDQNFIKFVGEGNLPSPRTSINWNSYPKPSDLIDLFESQIISRHLDLLARELKSQGKSYYTIGSSGHEGNAVFGKTFRLTDMAFLHYRSGALMIQRSKQLPTSTPIYDNLLSLCASSEDPISGGRHKVFGSLPLLVPPQTSTIASHLPKAVGAALSIGRAQDLKIPSVMPYDSVILCNFGDASSNHASAQSAFNTAQLCAFQHVPMPIVFICEDNKIGISVPTSERWIESNFSQRPNLLYLKADGLNLLDLIGKAEKAVHFARSRRKPVFLHMETIRLLGHAGSDVESNYKSFEEIERLEFQDPLLHSAKILLENNILSKEEIVTLYESIRVRMKSVSIEVCQRPVLNTTEEVKKPISEYNFKKASPPLPSEDLREIHFNKEYKKLTTPQHMAKLINWALTDLMIRFPNVVVFGEDVAQKGGVYHVTDDLYKRFGVKRVFNSPLDETSILGTAIGMAHNNFLPIPEIQFLAYVHNAEDQIRGEASTLNFFSNGNFANPMVIRIPGLGYQKGFGGHFHNDNSLTLFRDIPGIILAVPSNGLDAVKMLRTCTREAFENGRVCVFIEPIALYMTKDLHQEGDKEWSFEYPSPDQEFSLGDVGVYGDANSEITILTYGNGVYYSLQAVKEFKKPVQTIDLRWLTSMDWSQILPKIESSKSILIVDECRKSGSVSEGLVTGLVERLEKLPKIKVVAGEDCFIPLGPAAASGMPSKDSILNALKELQ